MREKPLSTTSPRPIESGSHTVSARLLERFAALGIHPTHSASVRDRNDDVPRFLGMLDRFEASSAKTRHRVD